MRARLIVRAAPRRAAAPIATIAPRLVASACCIVAPRVAAASAGNVLPLAAQRRDASTGTPAVLSARDAATVEEAAARALAALPHPATQAPLATHAGILRGVRCAAVAAGSSSAPAQLVISAQVEAFSPAAAHWRAFAESARAAVKEALQALPQVQRLGGAAAVDVDIKVVARHHARAAMGAAGPGLAGVGSVIAVSSGKGGVGKSTVAVNLAYALAARGARVGVLDADVHGPSLPTMVEPGDLAVRKQDDGCINALSLNGVRLMSYGWVAPRNAHGERSGGAMRGPMTSSVVAQLLKFTAWGPLDHLVIDMPPGTGDVLVTIGQSVPLATAVVVTTPQRLALADVAKGLDVLASLRVHTSALVLNMAYWEGKQGGGDASGGKEGRVYPYGDAAHPVRLATKRGADGSLSLQRDPRTGEPLVAPLLEPSSGLPPLASLLARYGITALHELPIDERLSAAGDSGIPFVAAFPQAPLSAVYDKLAGEVAAAAERNVMAAEAAAAEAAAAAAAEAAAAAAAAPAGAAAGARAAPADPALEQSFHGTIGSSGSSAVSVRYSPPRAAFLVRSYDAAGAKEVALPARDVRLACRCAACVDEASGRVTLDAARVPADVRPARLAAQGNYGLALRWSDGHDTGIYSFEQLAALAKAAGAAAGPAAGATKP